jgi:drug/metabolite transporter (DMT)-like permease
MIGGVLPLLLAIAMIMPQQESVAGSIGNPWWLFLDGAVLIPISFWCLATGPKYISGPEVAMFYLLETVLAPVWIWLIFGETPTSAALAGGAIITTALAAHSIWQYRREKRRAAAPAAVRSRDR